MKLETVFRNLDSHGRQRAPEVIQEKARQLEPRLKRFRQHLVRLEVAVSQTKDKSRIHASLRLQLPSGVIAAQEDGFEIEPVLRKAFADLSNRLDRHVARLKHEPEWKRPTRRARIGALLPPALDKLEAERRAFYFDLIEEHLDKIYDTVRRELTYLEASGAVPEGYISIRDLVDATILNGLDRFETRPTEFSVGDWLTRLAFETIEAEAYVAHRALLDDAVSLNAEPETPAKEPTEADEEMSEFYQPDAVLLLEDLVGDDSAANPETEAARHQAALALHRAIADLPVLWRKVLFCVDLENEMSDKVSAIIGIPIEDVKRIAQSARAYLREKLQEFGHPSDTADDLLEGARKRGARIPQPVQDRSRIELALLGQRQGGTS